MSATYCGGLIGMHMGLIVVIINLEKINFVMAGKPIFSVAVFCLSLYIRDITVNF